MTAPAPSPPTIARLRVPRVVPLEIWRLLLADRVILSRAIRRRPERLLEGLTLLHQGEGRTRDGRREHQICAGYEHLVIGGGRASAALDAVLCQGPTPFTRLSDPFIGEAGGWALADQAGFHPDEALVLDLGQTSIKVSYGARRCRLERDLRRLPRSRVPREQRPEQREALCDFLAEGLAEATAGLHPPQAIIVALPGEIDDSGLPGRSSYAGTEGNDALLRGAAARAGLAPQLIGVLNDAELAAVSACLLPEASGKTLVLTLGFGLGGAVLL